MDDLNLNQLKYFFDAATEQSVARAARLNFVTQPAISQAIRKLGESLETRLLVHGKNRFQLTEDGRLVFARCQQIFRQISDMRNELKASRREFSGSLRFATSQSIALTLLPRKLEEFRAKYPLIVPKFKLGRTSHTRQWIDEGLAELALAVDDGQLDGFERVVLHRGRFLAIHSTKAAIARPGFMITGARKPEAVALARHYEKKHRKSLPVTFEIESWEVIARLALEGLGIGLVPDFILDRQSKPEQARVRQVAIPEIPYEVCAFFKKKEALSRNASLFLQSLTEN